MVIFLKFLIIFSELQKYYILQSINCFRGKNYERQTRFFLFIAPSGNNES